MGGREPEQLGSLSQHREFSPLQGNSFNAAPIIALCTLPPAGEEPPCRQQSRAWLPPGCGASCSPGHGQEPGPAPRRYTPKAPALSEGQPGLAIPPDAAGAHRETPQCCVAQSRAATTPGQPARVRSTGSSVPTCPIQITKGWQMTKSSQEYGEVK